MITRVRVRHFKRFEEEEFDLRGNVVLSGPNNSGKTSLLQAIGVWNLAMQRWKMDKSPRAKGRQRSAIPITRSDFTAIPLREMNLLWKDTSTALRKREAENGKVGTPKLLEITIDGEHQGQPFVAGFEFRYQSTEQIYLKPCEQNGETPPPGAEAMTVVYIPPFSGIGVQEPRYDRALQDVLIGQGKAGDILRNLLLDVHQKEDSRDWIELAEEIEEVFGFELLPPRYEGPYITCEYRSGAEGGAGSAEAPVLDIASGGSGFHQVLLLLAFFYARPASVLLMDEPDAHLHVVLQKQIHDLIRETAMKRRCQLVLATHSEALIDTTAPRSVLSFFGRPHRLDVDTQRDQVREALRRLTTMDLLCAERAEGILYVESDDDFNLLRAWSKVLDHPLARWFFGLPYWRPNRGRDVKEAKAHFFALKAIRPDMRGVLLLDGDNRKLDEHQIGAESLAVLRWRRYESESYLIDIEPLMRFLESRCGPLLAIPARRYLEDQIPAAVLRDPRGQHGFLETTPASKTLLPGLFAAVQVDLDKRDYHSIAAGMRPEEVPTEVKEKLDAILAVVAP
jgi:predicted ATPase